MKFRSKYEYTKRWGNPAHTWSVVCAAGGMHLHITDHGEEHGQKYGERYSGGIESHSRTPTSDTPPDHDNCWLLGCPCWHDGSSLQASEYWIPLFLSDPNNHEMMLTQLEGHTSLYFRNEDA